MLDSFVRLFGRSAVGGFLVWSEPDGLGCLCLPWGSAGLTWCCLVLSVVLEVGWYGMLDLLWCLVSQWWGRTRARMPEEIGVVKEREWDAECASYIYIGIEAKQIMWRLYVQAN